MSKIKIQEDKAFLCLCGYALFFAISVAIANFFLGLALLAWLLSRKRINPIKRIPINYLRAIFSFFFLLFILVFFSEEIKEGFLRFWRFFSKLLSLFLVIGIVKEKKQIFILMMCVFISIAIMDSYAILQGIQGNFRAQSFFSHAMYMAGILVQFMPIIFLIILLSNRMSKWGYLLLSLSGIAITFNGTRGAWGAIIITAMLVVLLYGENRKKAFCYFIAILLLIVPLFNIIPDLEKRVDTITDMSYQSNSERVLMWKSAWNMFNDYPMIGVGLGRYEYYYQNQYISPKAKERMQGHAHNNFMQLLAETGIMGTSGFCYMFGSFMFYSLLDWFKRKRVQSLMFFLSTLGLMIQGMTETNFGNGVVMNFYYFLMGLYLVSLDETKKINF